MQTILYILLYFDMYTSVTHYVWTEQDRQVHESYYQSQQEVQIVTFRTFSTQKSVITA